jgi:putative glutamine transport system substrate-binding protein
MRAGLLLSRANADGTNVELTQRIDHNETLLSVLNCRKNAIEEQAMGRRISAPDDESGRYKPQKWFSRVCGLIWGLVLCAGLFSLAGLFSSCATPKTPTLEQIHKRGRLIAGVKYDSKPFGYLDSHGTLEGYDIDLLRELAKRILGDENAIEFRQVLSSTRVVSLNSGSIDIVAATMTITSERAKVVDFSQPYFIAHQAVLVPLNSPAHHLDDLRGKTILFVLGTTGETTIKKRLPQATYRGFKSSTDAFSALRAGEGDAMTTDNTLLSGFIADHCGFRLLPDALSDEPYGLAVRQDGGPSPTGSFRSAINLALSAMQRDGTLDRLRAKWLNPTLHAKPCLSR